jgi:hypothetical protein
VCCTLSLRINVSSRRTAWLASAQGVMGGMNGYQRAALLVGILVTLGCAAWAFLPFSTRGQQCNVAAYELVRGRVITSQYDTLTLVGRQQAVAAGDRVEPGPEPQQFRAMATGSGGYSLEDLYGASARPPSNGGYVDPLAIDVTDHFPHAVATLRDFRPCTYAARRRLMYDAVVCVFALLATAAGIVLLRGPATASDG